MKCVFLYNLEGRKSVEIKNLCRKMLIPYKDIAEDEYGYSLDYLVGLSGSDNKTEGESFDEEMLYIFGLTDTELNILLNLMRKRKSMVALKALATPTNLKYTSYELFREISAEHKAMNRGESIHDQA